jgi:HEPN domain-containing protein
VNRNDFRALARIRLREAEALLAAGHYSGAYYLAGYAVECALKACIARKTKAGDFPDRKLVNESYTHDIERLVVAAGLKEDRDDLVGRDERFRLYWGVASRWSPDSRYEVIARERAVALYTAVADQRHGVLRWLRRSY